MVEESKKTSSLFSFVIESVCLNYLELYSLYVKSLSKCLVSPICSTTLVFLGNLQITAKMRKEKRKRG